MIRTALTAIATTVAQAAPATPAEKYMTNTISRMMLSTVHRTRYFKGVAESPTALSIPEPALNSIMGTVPAKNIFI